MLSNQSIFSKTLNRFNRWGRDIGWQTGINKAYFRNARGARIILYHGLCTHDPFRFNSLFITLQTFESHLRFYKEYFNVISLDDFYAGKFSDDRFNICLSFDDGFANNYKYAVPLLEKYQLPASFFITAIRAAGYDILWNDFLSIFTRYGPYELTYNKERYIKNRSGNYVLTTDGKALAQILRYAGFDEKKKLIDTLASQTEFRNSPNEIAYWQQMTLDQIRQLSQSPLMTIGCHGYYHNDLAKISAGMAAKELTDSKRFMEKATGREISAMAFPYGAYSKEICEKAKALGFTQLLATEFLFPEDAGDTTLRERLTINPFISVINQMYAVIRGHYS